jgi:uncharacterized protein (DUF1330 family)
MIIREKVMKTLCTVALSMLAGFGMGAVAITGLNAQGKPGAYAVIDISEITDPEAFKQVGPKAGASAAAAGAHFVARTENIIALHGDAPKRFVLIAFDSIEKAKAFDATPAQKELNAISDKSTKSRRFIIEGM